jgi:SAM-dependent methyltransferase
MDALYDRTRDAWRAIWDETDIDRELQTRGYARSRWIRERFVPHLPSNAPLLEAGCGLGSELIGLAGDGYRVVGVDYVTTALTRLKAHRPGLSLAAADVHALPFRDGTFGAYLSFGVLEHFDFGPAPALREAHRALRAGGTLVLTVPSPNLVWRLVRARRRWPGSRAAERVGYFETAYSARDLVRYVRETGFDVLECHPVGHSFTLWGCGALFRGPGYYETSRLAEQLGAMLARTLRWSTSFATLIIARKRALA